MKYSFILSFLLLGACVKSEKNNSTKKYFDVPQLIDNQIIRLNSEKPMFLKKAAFEHEHSQKKSAEISWDKELKVFKDCDLNLPVLKDSYQMTETDTGFVYQTQDPKANVKQLIVKGKQETEAIYLHWSSKNPFYATEKWLFMQFQDKKLNRYGVTGYQKLIFKDSLKFETYAVLQ